MRVFLVVLLLFTGWGFAQQSNEQSSQDSKEKPSLVQLSRQAKARKAKQQKAPRVITNADLKTFQDAPVSMSQQKAAPGESEAESKPEGEEEAPDSTAGPSEKDLELWQGAFAEARLNLKNAVNQGLVLQLRMNNLRNAYFNEDDGTTQARIQQELEETLKQVEANKQDVAKAREELQELEKKAREAGLAAGMIRDLEGSINEEPEGIMTPETPTP